MASHLDDPKIIDAFLRRMHNRALPNSSAAPATPTATTHRPAIDLAAPDARENIDFGHGKDAPTEGKHQPFSSTPVKKVLGQQNTNVAAYAADSATPNPRVNTGLGNGKDAPTEGKPQPSTSTPIKNALNQQNTSGLGYRADSGTPEQRANTGFGNGKDAPTEGKHQPFSSTPIKNALGQQDTNVLAHSANLTGPWLTSTQERLMIRRSEVLDAQKAKPVSQQMENHPLPQMATSYMDRIVAEHVKSKESMFAPGPVQPSELVSASQAGVAEGEAVGTSAVASDPDDIESSSAGSFVSKCIGTTALASDTDGIESSSAGSFGSTADEDEAPSSGDETVEATTAVENVPAISDSSSIESEKNDIGPSVSTTSSTVEANEGSVAPENGNATSVTVEANEGSLAAQNGNATSVTVEANGGSLAAQNGNANDSKVTGRQVEDDAEEDRQHLAHFKSWGSPVKRDRPESRIRTVKLVGLPASADSTFVQSLIHGGSIEAMKRLPGINPKAKATALVTFTTGDACDQYAEKYPNGMVIRHEGKQSNVFVYKGDKVEPVSGLMQGYLDCGASRVVKATNADTDWGIVALTKMAAGRDGLRQVEAVIDRIRKGVRIILFRFTNISDAVKFKGELIRDCDWEGCEIGFAEDPCASATGIRYD